MELHRFTADYGTLPAECFLRGYVTNPAEVLRCNEIYGLLRLCGIEASENGAAASDWELFRSVGRALPLLLGHPMRARILQLLGNCFGLREALCEENCESLWRAAVDYAEEHPIRIEDLLPKARTAWLSDALTLPKTLPASIRPALLANLLLAADALPFADWCARIRATVEEYRARGGELVVLRLPREFAFVSPDPYHVGVALREKKGSATSGHLLLSQLMREVCSIARELGMKLLIESACDGSACELLAYASKSVGLPQTFVTASDAATRDRLIDCMKDEACPEIYLAVHLKDLPSMGERTEAWKRIAARYPSGRICVVCGADLRMLESVQGEIAEELLGIC